MANITPFDISFGNIAFILKSHAQHNFIHLLAFRYEISGVFHLDSVGKQPQFPFTNVVVVDMGGGEVHGGGE